MPNSEMVADFIHAINEVVPEDVNLGKRQMKMGAPAPKAVLAQERKEKFREIEETLPAMATDKEMLSNSKASWLTTRGNQLNREGRWDEAIADFKDAISLKKDYLPAHFSLALAYRESGQSKKALKTIESMPRDYKLHGNVLATKDEMLADMIREAGEQNEK